MLNRQIGLYQTMRTSVKLSRQKWSLEVDLPVSAPGAKADQVLVESVSITGASVILNQGVAKVRVKTHLSFKDSVSPDDRACSRLFGALIMRPLNFLL